MKKNKITDSLIYHLQIGDSYFKMGDIQKAYYHYNEAVKIEPNNVQALGNLAVTLYNLGKKGRGKVDFGKSSATFTRQIHTTL